ncbi:MAG: DUF1573 domain-containing protein [Reichenbachiella sp.]
MKQSQILYSLSFLLISFVSLGQEKSQMDFVETEHDFGEIKESDGPAIYEFEFVNNRDTPIIISGVKASCGCTTPAWSKEPVLPGEKGFIKAQYNPRNRPGSFRKTLTVTANVESGRVYLYIKGKVIPRIKTIEEKLPFLIGDIRMKSRVLNFSRITTKEIVEKSFDVYNAGEDTLQFLDKIDGPDFVKISFSELKIAPKQTVQMLVTYNPDHKNNLGLNDHGISIYTNEKDNAKKDITVRATISEYFKPLSDEEKAAAPKLLIEERMKDLGNVSTDATKVETFLLTNSGKSKLNIRKIDSNCSCIVATVEDKNIKPGQSTSLTVTFNAAKRRGRQTKSVTIYSNDPLDPTQMVTVKTMVVSGNKN